MNSKNENNIILMSRLKNESIDIICIDPPYKYLKNQKLDIDFDELKFFTEAKRILTKDGFIIMFGRGVSFYRMNCILTDLGFNFKEEVVWDKTQNSSPVMKISRVHETCSIFSKGKGIISDSPKIRLYPASKYSLSISQLIPFNPKFNTASIVDIDPPKKSATVIVFLGLFGRHREINRSSNLTGF